MRQQPSTESNPRAPNEAVAACARGAPARADEILDALRELLRSGIGTGLVSGDALADRLHLHRRTLNRRLRARGTTFRDVLDEVRYEIARELLMERQLGMAEISDRLGYSEPSAFTRAFRRWAGASPLRWRKHRAAR